MLLERNGAGFQQGTQVLQGRAFTNGSRLLAASFCALPLGLASWRAPRAAQ